MKYFYLHFYLRRELETILLWKARDTANITVYIAFPKRCTYSMLNEIEATFS